VTEPLTGRVAIVTGGARGIGRAAAAQLAGLGMAVAICDRDHERGLRTAAELDDHARVRFFPMDLAEPEQIERAVADVEAAFGPADTLVNNAAQIGEPRPLLELGLEAWRQVMDVNLTGTFLISQAVARRLVKAGRGGVIVNIQAIQPKLPLAGYTPYCVSKGGLDAFTRVLAVELAPAGIRVNGIAVGSVFADSMKPLLPEGPEWQGEIDPEHPPTGLDESAGTLIGRMGRPSDIARVVGFLVSDDAAYLTGSVIRADGGRLISRRPDPLAPGGRPR
jgi:NAD(P)-dependent dehydrogenase (short-subunit alcohol dehydrogenase family)